MSHSHLNYMNGVPVKIAESYKPPKKLALNQSVSQRLSTSSSVTMQLLDKCTYDFSLERTVQAKMCEWQHMRHRENCDRKDRMRLYQQEKQSLFDAKQKQMLTAVSYPSTDDLSSDDDGDDSGHGTSSDASKSAVSMKTVSIPAAQPKGPTQQFSPPNYFNNILVPTVMPGQEKQTLKSPHYSKINFQEFENDTSSPFDSVELKTINDLDILAEVWNTSVAIKNDDTPSEENTETSNPEQTKQPVNTFNHGPINRQLNEISAKHHSTATNSSIPITSSYYVNQVHYNHQIDPSYPVANHTYTARTINNNPTYPYESSSNYVSPNYNQSWTPAAATNLHGDTPVIPTNNIQSKSKSKSVPDIVQEINTELVHSQGRRVRKNSQDEQKDAATPHVKHVAQVNSFDANPTYSKLSNSSRNLARSISSMGFPLEQVARITEKLGKDDKRIIEHLIRLGELLDLGFDEDKISEALLKFDNNKEKALDFLIS